MLTLLLGFGEWCDAPLLLRCPRGVTGPFDFRSVSLTGGSVCGLLGYYDLLPGRYGYVGYSRVPYSIDVVQVQVQVRYYINNRVEAYRMCSRGSKQCRVTELELELELDVVP